MPQVIAGGIISATGVAAGSAAALAINIGVGVGFSLLANQLLAPDVKAPEDPGIQTTTTTRGEFTGQNLPVGRYAIGGHRQGIRYSHREKGGSGPGSIRTTVFELADLAMPGSGLAIVIVNGVRLTIDRSAPDADFGHTVTNAKYRDKIYFKYYDGTQTTADPMMRDRYGDHPEYPWLATHVGFETAYVIVTQRYDREIFPGDSTFTFELEGIPLYNPAEDSSVGGVGDQRWGDPDTWKPSANPIVISYNIARGITCKGGLIYGGRYAADDLPLDWWLPAIAAAEVQRNLLNPSRNSPDAAAQKTLDNDVAPQKVSDAIASLTGLTNPGALAVFDRVVEQETDPSIAAQIVNSVITNVQEKVTEATRFRVGYNINLGPVDAGGTTPIEVMNEMGKAAIAQFADVGGRLYVLVGVPQLPQMFITDNDLLTDGSETRDPFFGREDAYNAVTASYPGLDVNYQSRDAQRVVDSDAVASDGKYLPAHLNLKAIVSEAHAQDVMQAYLRDGRRMVRHSMLLPPDYASLIPLNAVDWVSDYNGYTGKDFEVSKVRVDTRTLNVGVVVREIDPTDTALYVDQEVLNPEPSLTPIFFEPETVPGAGAEGAIIVDGNGVSRRSGWRGFWGELEPDVTGIDWGVRPQGQTQIIASGTVAQSKLADLEFYSSEGVAAQSNYEVRFRLVANRETLWTSWYPFTTPQVGFTLDDMDAGVAIGIEAGSKALADGIALGNNQLDIYLRITEEQATNADNFDGARAAIFTEQTIREEADLAQATLITGLGAALGDAESRILTVESTKVDASGAVAAISQELSASNGEFEALANFTSIANAAANSSQAIYLFTAQAGQADAALEIAALSDGNLGSTSRVKLTSDVIIMDSNLSAFGGIVQSTGAVVGEQGWILNDDGSIQAADIQDLRRYTYSGFEDLRGIGTTEITVFDQASGVDFISGIRRLKGTCDVRASAVITTDTEYRISVYIDAYVSGSPVNIFESSRTHVLGSATSPGSVRELSEAIEVEVPTDAADVPGSISFIGPTSEVDPRDIEGFRVRISGNRTGVLSYWKFEFYQ